MIPTKPIVIGPPRGGFSLLIHICSTLLRSNERSHVFNTVWESSRYLLSQYKKVFLELGIKKDVIFNKEFYILPGGPKWLDKNDPEFACIRKYIGIKGKGDMLLVVRHPRKVLEYYPVIHSHESPKLWVDTSYYDKFVKLTAIRNPLGIINSACFSLNAMASEYIQRFSPDINETVIRQKHGAYKLTDMKFMKGLIKYLKVYLDEFLEVKNEYFTMRWEDLINYPIETVKSIGIALGIRISNGIAQGIWDSMKFKNLPQFHKHNFNYTRQGIIDSWRKSFVNEHMELFKTFDFNWYMNWYLKRLGYSPVPRLDPKEYTPFQKLIARHIQRKEIFNNIGDKELFDLAFNKSNIDISEFDFKSYPPKKWVHVERSTIEDETIVEAITNTINDACDKVNGTLEKL